MHAAWRNAVHPIHPPTHPPPHPPIHPPTHPPTLQHPPTHPPVQARDDADGSEILAELRREVAMLATLRHPCVVQCIGATDNATTPWLVLEYLERTLYEAVADATESAMVSMLCDVLSACAYLHSRPCPIARQPASRRVAPGPERRQHHVGPAQSLWRRLGA